MTPSRYTIIVPTRTPHPGVQDGVLYSYDEGRGKKWALYRGISAAGTDYVYLTDDDVPLPQSIPDTDADMLIFPLRMEGGDSLIERLQIAEYAALQQLTVEAARRGHAVMCSGASLLVRRDRWLESWPDLHTEIPSGDDMFLLESFKRRGLRVEVADTPITTVTAVPTLRAFLRQRMRWAGKAPHYTDRDILLCGAVIAVANLLQMICPLILLVKFPVEYHLIRKRDPHRVSLSVAILLELIYPWYMLVCLIGGLLHPHRW